MITPVPTGETYLALDQGGHGSRALVFDSRATIVAQGYVDIGTRYPHDGWVEQNPEEVVDSLTGSIAQVAEQLGDRCRNIKAAGLATQRSSIVCWNRNTGGALSPVISWQDRRAHASVAQYVDRSSEIHERTGLFLNAHYGATKLRWCLDHLPAVREACEKNELAWGPLASFLIYRLLHERPHLIDPSNASRTLLWNLKNNDWDPELLALFGLPDRPLPRIVPTRHDYGHISLATFRIPLTIVAGDQPAALFSLGYPQPSAVYINVGTGAFVQRTSGRLPQYQKKLLTSMVMQDSKDIVYALEGTVNGAAAALDWMADELHVTDVNAQLPVWLQQSVDPPLFLNGVGGLGTPFWIPDFVSRFIGDGDDRDKLVAVIESIIFLLMVNLEAMRNLASPPETIHIGGGLTALDGLCQRLADLAKLPVYRPADREATARGTAYLLAGCPTHWPENRHGAWFNPLQNPGIDWRYRRWHDAMRDAVS